MTVAENGQKTRFSPEEAQAELGIGSTQYYDRIKELGIKAHRDKGKAYLDNDQMQRLRDYIQGKSAIAIVETDEISLENFSVPNFEEISSEQEQDIWRRAEEIKAEQLTAEDLMALKLAEHLNFDDLSSDLKERVKHIKQISRPGNLGKSLGVAAKAMIEKRRNEQK